MERSREKERSSEKKNRNLKPPEESRVAREKAKLEGNINHRTESPYGEKSKKVPAVLRSN